MLTLFAFLIPMVLGCPQVPPTTAPAKPKIVVFTFAGGFKHETLALAEQTIRELGETSGAFEATLLKLHEQPAATLDLGFLNAEFLKPFAAIVFYTTSGEKDLDLLSAAQRDALVAAIRGGTAFVGIHSATDTFYRWPEYGEMIGAYFNGHPWTADGAPVTIKIDDPQHPACLKLGESWFLQEEIYQFREPYRRDKLHVLMRLDTAATDMSVPGVARADGDFALAWTKFHGKGRVFYTALGHREDVWRSELFREHLLGGIRWSLGQMAGQPFESPTGTAAPFFTASGLQYRDVVVGDGIDVKRGMTINVHYTGWLADGVKFDSSYDHGEPGVGKPMSFLVGYGHVIAGWDEGLIGMRVGGTRRLIVPPQLAYGRDGAPPAIPPNATLTFEVKVLGVP